jgi:NAD(P)-dependent dehydrogenase (short-subunit alcohol dehydrogenase family)
VLTPGPTDTPVFGRTGATEAQIAGAKTALISHTPLKRLAGSAEIAQAYLYAASDDSRYMLGAELVVDGGYRTL